MDNLKTFQRDFLNSIYEKNGFEHYLQNNDYIESFDIYINNCYLGLIENLKNKFPICEKLLGEEYFSNICEKYIKSNPLNHGQNNSYGENFSNFIFEILEEFDLTFVSQIAKIEWAKFNCEIAKVQDAINFQDVQKSFQDCNYESIKLRDCVQIIELSCNGFEIYFEQLNNEAKTPNPIYENQNILIYIDEKFDPYFKKLTNFQFKFLKKLYENQSFITALNETIESEYDTNLAQSEFVEICNLGIFTK